MSKRLYILVSFVVLLFVAFNIYNDRYYMNYSIGSLAINNYSKTSRNSATIYGDGSNGGSFVSTSEVSLPKGAYKIIINYKTDTELNYVNITGKASNEDVVTIEKLSSAQKQHTIDWIAQGDTYNVKIDIIFSGTGELVVKNIVVESAQISSTDTVVWFLIFAVVLFLIGKMAYYNKHEKKRENLYIFLCLIIITIFASFPLYNNYVLNGHDIMFHVTRIEGIKNGLLSGQVPVRIHPSTQYEYGFASSIFYPELFLYFPAILRILGVSTTGAVQIFIVLINFVTASIMYLAVYKISKNKTIGIWSSGIYVLASYHLCDVYVRFALGETLAMAFIPLLIYGIYELFYNDYSKWPYVVISATGIMQSHILTTLLSVGFVILVATFNIRSIVKKKRMFTCIKTAIVIVFLNLWFLVPFLDMAREDMKVSAMAKNVDDNAINLLQLFQNLTILQIGLPILVGSVMFIYCFVFNKIEDKKQEKLIMGLLCLGILSAFITTNLFPWRIIVRIPVIGEMVKMIQFPWRLLAFATAFLSIVAAYGFYYITKEKEIKKVLGTFLVALCVLCASLYLENNYLKNPIYAYKGAITENTGIGDGEYYYKGTSAKALKERGDTIKASSEQVILTDFKRLNSKIYVDVENESDEEQFIEVPLAYYPFYNADLNEEISLRIEKGKNNVLRIILPADAKGNIIIHYSESKFWLLSNFISLIASAIFIVKVIKYIKFKRIDNISLDETEV
jgi:hypothetical protein